MVRLASVAALAAAALCACDSGPDVLPPNGLPRDVELDRAVLPLAGLTVDGRRAPGALLVDTAASISSVAAGPSGLATGSQRLERVGLLSTRTGAEQLAFADVEVLVGDLLPVGRGGNRELAGVLGGDVLSRFVVTFDYAQFRLTLDDRALTEREDIEGSVGITLAGGNPLELPLAGGGTRTVTRLPTHVVVPACIGFQSDPETGQLTGGTDATAIVATGTAQTVVARSFAERAGLAVAGEATYHTASGAYPAQLAAIPSIALVTDLDRRRSPCEEMAHARRFLRGPATTADLSRETASLLWLTQPREVLVVDDGPGLPEVGPFDVLRVETRPRVPAIDVILGSDYLSWTELTIDYRERRMLPRCRTDRSCPECERAPCIRQAHCTRERLGVLPALPEPEGPAPDGGADGGLPSRAEGPRLDVSLCLPFP